MFVVWQVYNELRTVFNEVKEKRDKLAEEFNSLNAAHDPLKRRLTESNRKSHGLSQEITKTQETINQQWNQADRMQKAIEKLDDQVQEIEGELNSRKQEEAKRRRDVQEIREQITALELELNSLDETVDYQPAIDKVSKELHEVSSKLTQMQPSDKACRDEIEEQKRRQRDVSIQLQKLLDVGNQRLQELRRFNEDAYKAVMWLRGHHNCFKKVIHEPMVLTINMKDARYAKFLENIISNKDLVAFICEDADDVKTFMRHMHEQKLTVNIFQIVQEHSSSFQPQHSIDKYKKYGFVSYMRELFTCPEPVMRYLCKMYNVHRVPVGTRHTKDNLEAVVRHCPEIKLFYTDIDRYAMTTSVYTKEQSSLRSTVRDAKLLAVGNNETQEKELQSQLQAVQKVVTAKEKELAELQTKIRELARKDMELRNEKKRLIDKKAEKATLVNKIDVKKNRSISAVILLQHFV